MLVARKAFRYAGRNLKAGEQFEADGRWARTLIAAQLAAEADESPPPRKRGRPKKQVYETREMVAHDPVTMPGPED